MRAGGSYGWLPAHNAPPPAPYSYIMLLRSPQFLHFLPDKDLEMHLMNSYRQLMAATAPVVFLVSEGYGCISAQTKPDEISGAMLYNNAYGHGQFVQECESTYGNDTLASVYAEWLDWTEPPRAERPNQLREWRAAGGAAVAAGGPAHAGVGPAGRADSDFLLQRRPEAILDHFPDRPQRRLPGWVLRQPAMEMPAVIRQQHLEAFTALRPTGRFSSQWMRKLWAVCPTGSVPW